ncbi:hypothetical protein GOP47_0025970 [Adiantum capillus-veneris]|uniref:Uncharacterized protein n=1 Tax=Adiantum capillus-veneris TaxID=13818 RepID=A0A9D4Z4M8_ADICA|nr:hypothetical protein GOP47_0025970 [Adiantum capillus-veneris]
MLLSLPAHGSPNSGGFAYPRSPASFICSPCSPLCNSYLYSGPSSTLSICSALLLQTSAFQLAHGPSPPANNAPSPSILQPELLPSFSAPLTAVELLLSLHPLTAINPPPTCAFPFPCSRLQLFSKPPPTCPLTP